MRPDSSGSSGHGPGTLQKVQSLKARVVEWTGKLRQTALRLEKLMRCVVADGSPHR